MSGHMSVVATRFQKDEPTWIVYVELTKEACKQVKG